MISDDFDNTCLKKMKRRSFGRGIEAADRDDGLMGALGLVL
jgi:hypothetical protein